MGPISGPPSSSTTRRRSASPARTPSWWSMGLPPDVTITQKPSDPSNDTSPSFSFLRRNPTAASPASSTPASLPAAASPKSYPSLAEGRTPSPSRRPTLPGTPGPRRPTPGRSTPRPRPRRSRSKPPDPTNDSSPTFSFSSGEPGSTFACHLDDAAFAPCTSPKTYTDLADGSHTFAVRATDAAGNAGADTTYTWTIDTAAPTVTITQQAQRRRATSSRPPSPSPPASRNLRMQARRSGALPRARSPKSYARPCRRHAQLRGQGDRRCRQRRARDDLHLDDRHGRADDDDHRQARRSEQRHLAELRLRGERARRARVPIGRRALRALHVAEDLHRRCRRRAHLLRRGIDAAGNAGAASTYSWTIDVVAPSTTISVKPADPTQQHVAELLVHGERERQPFLLQNRRRGLRAVRLTEDLHDPRRRLAHLCGQRHRHRPATPARTRRTPGRSTPLRRRRRSRVSRQIRATTPPPASPSLRARPAARSRASSTLQPSLPASPRRAMPGSPRARTPLPSGPATPPGTWASRRPSPGRSTPSRRRPRSPASRATRATAPRRASRSRRARPAAPSPASSTRRPSRAARRPRASRGLADGSHTFAVEATDPAGNTSTQTSYTWTIDTVAPTASITGKPSDPSNSTAPSFTFTASQPGSTFACKLDAAAFAACTSPKGYAGLTEDSPHLRRQGHRPGRKRQRRDELHLDDRHSRADGDDHAEADRPEQQRRAELHVHGEPGRQHVRLQARRRGLCRLYLAAELHGPR